MKSKPPPALSFVDPKKLNPAPVLARINTYAKVGVEGRVSYTGWEYHEDMPLIYGMFRFEHHVSPEIARSSISRAVGVCIRDKRLTADHLLGAATKLYAEATKSAPTQFHLLSELSLVPSGLIGRFTVGDAKVQLLRGAFPPKYSSRAQHEKDYKRQQIDLNPPTYTKVVVDLEAVSADLGFQVGMDAIDAIRALISMNANLAMETQLGGERFVPINKVVPGGLHTLHHPDGTSAYNGFWYEPLARFQKPHQIKPDREAYILKGVRRFSRLLNRAKDREFAQHLLRSLTQYVRAFDEPDPSNCLLKGWTALEQLVGDNAHGDGEKVVARVSFLYSDSSDMQLTLNVIKEARNDIAHRGPSRQRLRTHCYWIQSGFVRAFRVYLGALRRGRSKEDTDQLLDLPPDVAKMGAELHAIELRKVLLKSGLKFRR